VVDIWSISGRITVSDFRNFQKSTQKGKAMAAKTDIKNALGKLNPFGRSKNQQPAPAHGIQPPGPTTGPLPALPSNPPPSAALPSTPSPPPVLQAVGEDIQIVNYTPEQLLLRIDQRVKRIDFGARKHVTRLEWIADMWGVYGPVVLLIGTVGEVFAFIWNRAAIKPDIATSVSILATVVVLEATFAVVSWKSSTIRNRIHRRTEAVTPHDKTVLMKYRITWFILAAGVAAGQIGFLLDIAAGAGTMDEWFLGFTIVRTIVTLASDFYSAFIHEDAPTSAEQDLEARKQEEVATAAFIQQEISRIDTYNHKQLELQRMQARAKTEQGDLKTELKLKEMENENRISSMQVMRKQAEMFSGVGETILQAAFDPEMPEEKRKRVFNTLQALGSLYQELTPSEQHPPLGQRTVTEAPAPPRKEPQTGDL
jgi:hypothetical protein